MLRTRKIYLDYAASTPVDPAIFASMKPYFTEKFGNPGSLHSFGQEAIGAIDASREAVAKAIGAEFREIIFTASATEANNLALRGIVRRGNRQSAIGNSRRYPISDTRYPRIIISSIEHESVLETARELEREGIEVVYLPVNHKGIVDLKKLEESLTPNTLLVSIMHANNEIGTIQPISKIAEILSNFRNEISNFQFPISEKISKFPITQSRNYPLLHIDAAQSFQFLDCNVKNLGVDLMTLSAHKIYGPKGAGCLYVKNLVASSQYSLKGKINKLSAIDYQLVEPQLTGGRQEFSLRSGTENVPAIVGFAKAAERLFSFQDRENKRIASLCDNLLRGIKKIYPTAEINGEPLRAKGKWRSNLNCLPNILNIYFPKHDAQDFLTRFDLSGLAVSSGSACRSRAMESSYVIEALGYPKERARSSIRFSLGRPTTKKEIEGSLKIMKKILEL